MSAILSSCRKFRYRLTRDVNKSGKVTIAYFGINPSTADEKKDDPTVRRWRGFTERNNGVKFIIGNVFAFRATDVGELARAEDPVGPENMLHIDGIISEAPVLMNLRCRVVIQISPHLMRRRLLCKQQLSHKN